jgi:hypothetical protein
LRRRALLRLWWPLYCGYWSSFSTAKASRESSARSLRRSHELRRSFVCIHPKCFVTGSKLPGPWIPGFDLVFTIGFGSRVTGCDDYFLQAASRDRKRLGADFCVEGELDPRRFREMVGAGGGNGVGVQTFPLKQDLQPSQTIRNFEHPNSGSFNAMEKIADENLCLASPAGFEPVLPP